MRERSCGADGYGGRVPGLISGSRRIFSYRTFLRIRPIKTLSIHRSFHFNRFHSIKGIRLFQFSLWFRLINCGFFTKLKAMGYDFDDNDAKTFERRLAHPRNRMALERQNRLMIDMLKPMRGQSVLDIGCGTGARLMPLLQMGLDVTAIDVSEHMLRVAAQKTGSRVELRQASAEDLPFEDNAFNFSCLVTTLEFVENPRQALAEACRVTKDRIFVGIVNRYSIQSVEYRLSGIFTGSPYRHARFYSIWEIKRMLRDILGDVPISWKTQCRIPRGCGWMLQNLETFEPAKSSPFGGFAGLVVSLIPRYRVRPLDIRCAAETPTVMLVSIIP